MITIFSQIFIINIDTSYATYFASENKFVAIIVINILIAIFVAIVRPNKEKKLLKQNDRFKLLVSKALLVSKSKDSSLIDTFKFKENSLLNHQEFTSLFTSCTYQIVLYNDKLICTLEDSSLEIPFNKINNISFNLSDAKDMRKYIVINFIDSDFVILNEGNSLSKLINLVKYMGVGSYDVMSIGIKKYSYFENALEEALHEYIS